ncbi:hypothetical protein FBY35_6963 [Streptomyces sp. SLBN-118]|nr:hypothetical protein FBY35_6963 [Streptomyces sp. SLBN-118]
MNPRYEVYSNRYRFRNVCAKGSAALPGHAADC